MKKEYNRRKDENLAQWIERLVPAMMGKGLAEVHDMVSLVSKESYLAGVHAEREVSEKFRMVAKRKQNSDCQKSEL